MSDRIIAETFKPYGGQYIPETLKTTVDELEAAYAQFRNDPEFWNELNYWFKHYSGRPTPLYSAGRLSEYLKGAKIYLKREDLNHTGAHKINNTLGQILLARRMGKKRIIAETGAGQHGVATATVCALFGLECIVYMGEEDTKRQALNVFRMELLGAKVVPVMAGTRTLKDATSEAIRDWMAHPQDTFYIIGSVVGPHPYPTMVRDFQSVIGKETKEQYAAQETARSGETPPPPTLVACVGGGSNAMGMFYPFIADKAIKMVGVEASGHGLDTQQHAASLTKGKPGVLHGSFSYLLQTGDGQVKEAHSISAGLDYPGVGPEHAFLKDSGRVTYTSITDAEALEGFKLLCKTEGIIPALESAHAIAYVMKAAPKMSKAERIIVCLSGRGDKDVMQVQEMLKGQDSGFGIQGPGVSRYHIMQLSEIFKTGKQLIPYLTAGDPDLEWTAKYLDVLEKSSVKIVELGIPFSDPLADGPVIQASHQRAITGGTNLTKVFELVKTRANGRSPLQIIFMLDYNLVYHHGVETFVADCQKSGVAGVLVPNLPLEDVHGLSTKLQAAGIAHIHLVSSSTPTERLKTIADATSGFLYILASHGVTGVREAMSDAARQTVEKLRKVTDLPLVVGFGISTPDQVKEVWGYADGAIVGSALVKVLHEAKDKFAVLKAWIPTFVGMTSK